MMFGFNNTMDYEICGDGVKRKILTYSNKTMMVEVTFEKDAVGAIHTHSHEQISYIAKGSFEFNLDGQKKVVHTGDSILIPSDLPHGVIALEDDSIIVDVFTPPREDFLK